MNNIKNAFKNGKAFIPFITCGDPDLKTTEETINAAVENGADLIELGIPFSDPTAEFGWYSHKGTGQNRFISYCGCGWSLCLQP